MQLKLKLTDRPHYLHGLFFDLKEVVLKLALYDCVTIAP